jgi:hypothetical protein
MLMPAGPPAMKLVAMAEMDDADENDKMSIARVLMVRRFPQSMTGTIANLFDRLAMLSHPYCHSQSLPVSRLAHKTLMCQEEPRERALLH